MVNRLNSGPPPAALRFGKAHDNLEYHQRMLAKAKPAFTSIKDMTLNDMVREPKNAEGDIIVRPGKPWNQVKSWFVFKADGSVEHKIQFPPRKPGEKPSEPTTRPVLPKGSMTANWLI